uniref:Uncharacterized protein n=1 Tax=Anguilla anguilla TaxID=7936 RepID=A0A0E9U8Z8_ANGAN
MASVWFYSCLLAGYCQASKTPLVPPKPLLGLPS